MKTAARSIDRAPTLWRKPEPSRAIALPPPDRAYWQAPLGSTGPLLYLAWGERQFGQAPIARRRHDGWVVAVVEEGSPLLVREHGTERIVAGQLVVLGPDSGFGWQDAVEGACKLLVWMWREPMHPALSGLARSAFVRRTLHADEFEELRQLHVAARSEVQRSDAHSELALGALQTLLETRIARIGGGDPEEDITPRAVRWIETHLATRQPLARLADFLGVSGATVHRVFREQLGVSVRQKIIELRCQEAERLLACGRMTIKEVAYRLGYRHPHDFSRAFRNHVGVLPTQQRTMTQARVANLRVVAA
jgi:AraC-like DNA-binding protein